MTAPDPETVTTIVAIVTDACRSRYVFPGRGRYGLKVWVDRRDIERAAVALGHNPDVVTLTTLRAVARAGHIAEQRLSRGSAFTTKKLAAAVASEEGLTPRQRAERTAAQISEHYHRYKAENPDRVDLWPVNAYGLAAVCSDGIAYAVELELIRRHTETRFEKDRFVPAAAWDEFKAMLARQQALEQSAHRHHADIVEQLLEFAGPGSLGEHKVQLTTSQAERLLRLLERGPAT